MKLGTFILLLGMLASGLISAEESGALFSRTSTTAQAGFTLGHGSGQMTEYAIEERIRDLLGLFELADSGESSRHNIELDLENEDSDWSFEVTVTVEF